MPAPYPQESVTTSRALRGTVSLARSSRSSRRNSESPGRAGRIACARPMPNEIADTAKVLGSLKLGVHFSCLFTSVAEMPHSELQEIYGTEGGILMDQAADPVIKVFPGDRDFIGEAIHNLPGLDAWNAGGWHYGAVRTEAANWIDSAIENRATFIDARGTVYGGRTVETPYGSIRSGEEVDLWGVTKDGIG